VNATLTSQSCERIKVSGAFFSWDAQGPTNPPWPDFRDEAQVERRLAETELPKLVLQMGEDWCGWVNLDNAIQIVRYRAKANPGAGELPPLVRIEWPSQTNLVKRTEIDYSAPLDVLDDETEEYIQRLRLTDAVAWLQPRVSAFFPGLEYEISVLPAEDGEEGMLALRVYGAMSAAEFREQRHAICQAMLDAGHRGLYDVISVFQRRMRTSGRQVLYRYSSVLA
jgi:hypothetical protein